ncbi:MAG: carbohydrate kinase [Sideroxydans sp.]|nr:carbohydrate kinase [Sideroxydans sp.]
MKLESLFQSGGWPSPRAHRKRTIALFGEVLTDIFPDRSVLGGAPFNVAMHLKAFAQKPVMISRLGNDAAGIEVLHTMSEIRMETLGVQCDKSHPTGQVKVHIQNGVNRFEILPRQAYDFIHPAVARMITLSVHPELVYFGTMAQRHETSRRALRAIMGSTGAPRFLDVNLRPPWYDEATLKQSLQYADIVKLNAEELGILTKMFEPKGGNTQEQVLHLMNRFDLEQVVVTCGEQGAWQMDREGKKVEAAVSAPSANAVDTVGAGDGFAAVYILGSLMRWKTALTLARANAFAAAICGIRGAVPEHADFYQPFIAEWGI